VGTSGNRGKTERFAGAFDDYTKGKIDNYGLITPIKNGMPTAVVNTGITVGTNPSNLTINSALPAAPAGGQLWGFGLHDVDNNNFARRFNRGYPFPAGTNAGEAQYRRGDDMAYWSATLDFGKMVDVPLFLDVKGDIGNNSGVFTGNMNGNDYYKVNGGVRVSGVKLGNIITFDVVYQFRGGDDDTWENDYTAPGNVQPDGQQATAHTFGVYANLFVINNFGIGIGYSGLFRTYEDDKTAMGTTTVTRSGPFFQGVDLRFQFTGVPNLTITLNNAFTVAFAEGTSDTNKRVVGLAGDELKIGGKEEQAWYALYNALGINYKLTPALTANFGVSNKIGMFNHDDKAPAAEDLSFKFRTNQLGATINAQYKFNSFVMVQGGLQFYYDYASLAVKNVRESYDYDTGMMYFAIPLRLQVVY
jgi:hypothetical protein